MSDIKSLLQDKLKENRSSLSPSSIRTYVFILSNLYKKMDGEGCLDFFKMKYNDILKHLEDKNNQTRKTTLSSLFILTGMREYQTEMQSIMKKVNEEYKNQKMNAKQKDNWISTEEIKEKYDSISAIAISMLNKKK